MIPVRLKLRNFMSYKGDLPAFSFSGIHTACISGDNGAGKSSLIDAMTWALWGKTRATSDDELISIGADEVEVEFDFNASGNLYRIIRKRSKAKKAGSAGLPGLDLLIYSDEGFNSITGDTLTKTQESIKNLLRMDYDTFINSAYLRQGHADEFSRQTPAKRKEVLASILKLEVYNELADIARQKTRERQAEKETLERAIEEIKNELAAREEVSTELENATTGLKNTEEEYEKAKSLHETLRQQARSLQDRQEQSIQLRYDSDERKRQLTEWRKSAESIRLLITNYEIILQQARTIEEGYQLHKDAEKNLERMSLQLNQLNRLSVQKNTWEKSIQSERARLNSQVEVAKRNVSELDKKISELTRLESALEKARAEQADLKKQQDAISTEENQLKSLEEQLRETRFQSAQSAERIRDIDSRIKLVSDNVEPQCPLCEKPLNDEERNFIIEKYVQEKNSLAIAIKEASVRQSEIVKTLNAELAGQKLKQSDLQKKILQNQQNISVLNHRISECNQASDKLATEKTILQQLENCLTSGDYAKNEQAELAKVNQLIADIDYNEDTYREARKILSATESYREQHLKLAEARNQIDIEKEKLSQAEGAIKNLQDRIDLDMAAINKMEQELKELPLVTSKLTTAETLLKESEHSLNNNREMVYKLQAKLEAFTELESKLAENKIKLKTVGSEESIFKHLARAFGKNGIQGMLIDMAIPEIENEANRILGKMTDNRMHMKLESQREKKTGGKAETLDIHISDEEGTRDYEMYSGGEAFRIDFALRIALSKLLANRSGAPLPTLIIDEGFGTQDNIGLEKVKEAINSIQDDFEVILVITHIDELKNAFNNRIEVTKTSEGSVVNII